MGEMVVPAPPKTTTGTVLLYFKQTQSPSYVYSDMFSKAKNEQIEQLSCQIPWYVQMAKCTVLKKVTLSPSACTTYSS